MRPRSYIIYGSAQIQIPPVKIAAVVTRGFSRWAFFQLIFFYRSFILFTAVPVPTHIPSGMSDLCASVIYWSAYLYLCALTNSPSKSQD
jgi:hypothetical protein